MESSMRFSIAAVVQSVLYLIGLILSLNTACGQPAGEYADKRRKVALTIGVARYDRARLLLNPLRDVTAVSDRLKDIGFDVVKFENSTWKGADRAIQEFMARAKGSDIALVYYSGHGLQLNGENYIVPSDFDPRKRDITGQLISVSHVLDGLDAVAKVKIILLDACRENPFSSAVAKARGIKAAKGLAPIKVEAPSDQDKSDAYGLIVGYATQPNDTADDGDGSLSPYAAGLLQATVSPDEDFNQSLVKAARVVVAQTNGAQRPEHRVALTQPLYLVARQKPLDCDILAAETDNNVSVKGVEFDKIDTATAISACQADLARQPDNPRLIHNLARSLDKAGKKAEAIPLYRRSAEIGYDWSQNNLAVMYLNGEGAEPDFREAMFWMRKAYAQGNRQAAINYADTDMSVLLSDSKERTAALQQALKRFNYLSGKPSGSVDDATRQALLSFKASKGIRGNGITFQVMDALGITDAVLRPAQN